MVSKITLQSTIKITPRENKLLSKKKMTKVLRETEKCQTDAVCVSIPRGTQIG